MKPTPQIDTNPVCASCGRRNGQRFDCVDCDIFVAGCKDCCAKHENKCPMTHPKGTRARHPKPTGGQDGK